MVQDVEAFAPSVNLNLSVSAKDFFKFRSVLKYPGPRNALRALPSKLVGSAKLLALKQAALAQLDPNVVGAPGVGSYSTVPRKAPFTVRLFADKLLSVAPFTMLKGNPVR
jgi:hypothetical protein